jgi:hypothetical protein
MLRWRAPGVKPPTAVIASARAVQNGTRQYTRLIGVSDSGGAKPLVGMVRGTGVRGAGVSWGRQQNAREPHFTRRPGFSAQTAAPRDCPAGRRLSFASGGVHCLGSGSAASRGPAGRGSSARGSVASGFRACPPPGGSGGRVFEVTRGLLPSPHELICVALHGAGQRVLGHGFLRRLCLRHERTQRIPDRLRHTRQH